MKLMRTLALFFSVGILPTRPNPSPSARTEGGPLDFALPLRSRSSLLPHPLTPSSDPQADLSLHLSQVCFSLNLLLIPLFEGTAPFVALFSSASTSLISPYFLLGNAFIAFSLNILALVLIQKIGGLALSLAGIVKDIALILGSGVVFGNSVTGMQVAGESGLSTFRGLDNKAN